MFAKALTAALVIAIKVNAEYDDDIEEFEPDVVVETQADEVEETQDFNQDISWANRAQSPDEPGWFKGDIYQAKSQEDKMTDLWGQIMEGANGPDSPAPLLWDDFEDLFTKRINTAFCQKSDEMKNRVKKVTHTQGVVARVQWQSTEDHPYTGLFEEGSDHAIIRLSETTNLNSASTGLLPGLALKFLVDGFRSLNIHTMATFKHTGSWDFFANPLTNRVEPFTEEENSIEIQTIQRKLVESSTRPFATSISEIARCYNDGQCVRQKSLIKVPYQIEFRSEGENWEGHHFNDTKELDSEGNQVMFYEQLKSINYTEPDAEGNVPEGANKLVEAWALDKPIALGGVWQKIADVNLMSPLYTSHFGDTRLYFQHRKISRDRKFWDEESRELNEDPFFDRVANPELKWPAKTGYLPPGAVWPEDPQEAEALYTSQIENHGCPFAWLLGMTD